MSPHAPPLHGSLPPEGADPACGGPTPDRFNPPAPLSAWISGIGLIAPGLPDWPSARAVLRGEEAWVSAPSVLPAPVILPPAERRRASRVIKLTLGIGLEAAAGADVATLATVFSSSGSDGHNCHALCEQLATDDRHVSPTRFHNSVHNAPAGYWGIATKSMAPCQVMCAFDGSFGAGLIDALGQVVLDQQATLLLAYDSEYPEPLLAKRSVPDCAGVALRLEPTRTAQALARITVQTTEAPVLPLQQPTLEALRATIPALRSLPLLECLAQGRSGDVCLDYLPGLQLAVRIEPA
ncbi:MAG: 3-oxoacyl-ACP synthase [Burkholderiales bacterium]|nr:MAG: 3-oxoacyl-ACP synthase [Burkholderiales bacterium]